MGISDAIFEDFLCACRQDEAMSESSCIVPAAFLLLNEVYICHDSSSIYLYIVE